MKLKGLRKKNLFLFSLPSIISSIFEPLASLVDTSLIGKLSTNSLASFALAATLFNSITWIFNFIVHASTQGVAEYSSSRNPTLLKQRIKISLIISFLCGILCSALFILLKDYLFSTVGGIPSQQGEFDEYFIPRAIFHLFTILSLTTLSILRGLSKLKLVLNLMIFSIFTNILFSYLFLYPLEMGIRGAALGTIIAHSSTFLISFFFLLKYKKIGLGLLKVTVWKENWLKFGRNSKDLFIRSLLLTSCFFISTRLASHIGVSSLGAHQVLLQVWLFSSFFLDGFAISGNILGARYFFGRQYQRTRIIYTYLVELSLIIGFIFTFSYWIFWDQIIGLFTNDLLVKEKIVTIKPVIILSQVISSLAFIFDGLIFGIDGFDWLRKHMLYGFLFIFLPMAFYTQYQSSILWIWLGLTGLNVYRSVTGYIYVKRKVWKNQHVIS